MSWIERAKVGGKVVFTNSEARVGYEWIGPIPVLGAVYTIADIYVNPCDDRRNGVHFELIEIKRPNVEDGWPRGFLASRFKPAKNTDTQVELLKRICLNTPETVS